MSQVTDCCSPCVAPVPTQVPGPEGPAGTSPAPGLNGGNAYTTLTANFTVPAVGANVTVSVASTAWMATGQYVFIPGAGIFQVATIFSAQSVQLLYIVDSQNTNTGAVIVAGAAVVPSGKDGTNGTNGSDGFTSTTANFIVPALDGTVLISVLSTAFMFVGQYVNIVGAGVFRVTNVNSGVQFTGAYPNFVGNTHAGATINSPALVSTTMQGVVDPVAFYAAGAAYSLTATPANVALGGNPTQVVLNEPGTWLIRGRIRYDYNGATFGGNRTVTTKLRRTNNTAADVANSSCAWLTQNITTQTYTVRVMDLPEVVYVTANNNDVIELWGSVSIIPSAGSLDATEADIVAVWLHP